MTEIDNFDQILYRLVVCYYKTNKTIYRNAFTYTYTAIVRAYKHASYIYIWAVI